MATSSEDQFRRLLLMRSEIALTIADHFLNLATPSGGSGDSLSFFREIKADLHAAEAVHIALLIHSGVSWDAVATRYGITRQALHKRFRASCDQTMTEAEEHEDLHESSLRDRSDSIDVTYSNFLEDIYSDLERGGRIWANRRKRKGWWWHEDDIEEWWN
ncbi:hypothetical protein [Nocardiopsis alba]|uniref:hypothetical protein n=1 Tax=Nocardiopsis alba TaxID=53437 RepID=UPI0033E47D76